MITENMHWIKRDNIFSTEDLPKDTEFLILYSGKICLCDYDNHRKCYYVHNKISSCETYIFKLDTYQIYKITHICILSPPEDY